MSCIHLYFTADPYMTETNANHQFAMFNKTIYLSPPSNVSHIMMIPYVVSMPQIGIKHLSMRHP